MLPDFFEAKYAALFERLQRAVGPSVFCTRRALTFDGLAGRQPALELRVTGMSPEHEDIGLPVIWTLGADVWLYAKNMLKDGSSDAELVGYAAAVVQSLQLQVGESGEQFTTLGGQVLRAWVSGTIEFMQGQGSDQAAALVPVEMVATEETL